MVISRAINGRSRNHQRFCSAALRFATMASSSGFPSSGSLGVMPRNAASVGAMSTVRASRSYRPTTNPGPVNAIGTARLSAFGVACSAVVLPADQT